MKLFIIGNGFDLCHGLKTSYANYKCFIEKCYPDLKKSFEKSYFSTKKYMYKFHWEKNSEWSDLESELSLSYVDYMKDIVANIPLARQEEYRMPDYHGKQVVIEDELTFLRDLTTTYFYKWVETIERDINNVSKCDIMEDATVNDIFLTFNYTKTLEKVYCIPKEQVCHIHGCIDNYDSIIFGTPDNDPEFANNQLIKSNSNPNDNMPEISVQYAIDELVQICSKASKVFKNQYAKLNGFIDRYNKVSEVIVIGSKYYGIDKPYYENILLKKLNTVPWTLYCHTQDDYIKAEEFEDKYKIPIILRES